MRPHSFRVGTSLLALPVLAALAAGQTVHRLTPTGPQVFADLQPAIDAAVEGDVLLVAPGTYSPFVIDGKGVSIFALRGDVVHISKPTSAGTAAIAIRNLTADQQVVLSGLSVTYPSLQNVHLEIASCVGRCFVQDGRFWFPIQSGPGGAAPGTFGIPAVRLSESHRVGFSGCELQGAGGEWSYWFAGDWDGGDGGPGLACADASVALYDCHIVGGQGGGADHSSLSGGIGGIALALQEASEAFVSGCSVEGGDGGVVIQVSQQCGGHGAGVGPASVLHHLDTVFVGGAGDSCTGAPIAGNGLVDSLPGVARRFTAPTIASRATSPTGDFEGLRGDLVWALASNASGFRWFPFGVLQLEGPQTLPNPTGVVPAGGVLAVPIDLTGLAAGVVAAQGFATEFGGARRLTGPRFLLSIDPASAPDCNGNGVNDYLDLVAGTSQDANANLVPDECPGG